ncbi:unnamed protein product [Arabidopsis lyrata]|uniref:uncharacterized protein LOC110225019 n=1 Tax=Arabidopsis lyrata subsp. lyrata TaxID=81972 RepID=UPI000A29DDE2|nr:uncharacterized protein LOC110225019 [Arabidopsis lyrata subsp. lyrata]CAH8251054.1 unnamed protein product [Arabidopsis lyrata]|eukprot:XP_020869168.1 uncharacterized protein LOC110225019 [Arabidopsis lyrata subsp. lyrata]
MDPKSSDVDTIEPEVMDASCSDLSSSCGKRKAETISPDEGCEEEERDSESDDQVWGFDSFEGSDYESPDEPPEDKEELEFRRYARHYHESQGFKVDKDKFPKHLTHGLRGLDLDALFFKPNVTGREYMEIMANVAIDKYNQVENKTVTLDHIVRVVVQMSYGIKGYITFMAKESPHGELVEYQAKAERKAWQRNIHPIFCRPAPS